MFPSRSRLPPLQPINWSLSTWPSLPCWACWLSFCSPVCCPAWSKWRRGPRGLLPWKNSPRTQAKRTRERLSDRLGENATKCLVGDNEHYEITNRFCVSPSGGEEHHQAQRGIQTFPGGQHREISEHRGGYQSKSIWCFLLLVKSEKSW